MSEPTREQIDALADWLAGSFGVTPVKTSDGLEDGIALYAESLEDIAREVLFAGYAPPERLREVEAERDAALGDARAGAGAAHWWDQR